MSSESELLSGLMSPERARIWSAWLRLGAAAFVLLLCVLVMPESPVLWQLMLGYTAVAVLGVFWARGRTRATWHLMVFLVLDVGAVSLAVFAFGVNTIVAAFFFPLVAGYVLCWGSRMGLVTMLLSLVAYSSLVLVQRYALPMPLLAPVPSPPAGPAYVALMLIPLFVMTSLGVYVFLHYFIRSIERQNKVLLENLAAARDAEQKRVALQERLAEVQRLESLGRLAGGVAHDFNNMLTAIQGYTELLADAVAHDPESVEDLAEVMRAAEQAADLTQQLLAFSRKQLIAPQVLDLCCLVKGLERMLVRVIGEDLSFKVTVSAEHCRVKADRTQLEQLIVNLVVNSRDALPQGGAISVEVKPVQVVEAAAEQLDLPSGGDYVLLTVRDSGEGMDAETLERIFEPFYTTKEKGRGTGLGLATVYGVVKQNGGGVRVSSARGSGTTFRVYLPRTEEAQSSSGLGASAHVGGDETVLVVEDEPTLRRLVERVLTRAGYTVHTCPDGAAALALMESGHPAVDLLLTDVVMPKMSGREVARAMRERDPAVRVLYMSGYTDGAMVDDGGLLAEDVNLLQKPFREATLLEAVRAVLDRGEWRRKESDAVRAS